MLQYRVNNYPHFHVNFSGTVSLDSRMFVPFLCLFVTSSQMSTLALTKTHICVQKIWEKGFEGFMVEATDQPLGLTSQFTTAFHIILWGVILGKQWALYLLLWIFLGWKKNLTVTLSCILFFNFPNPSNPNCHLWVPHAEHFIPHNLFCGTYVCNEHSSVPEDYHRPQMNKRDAPIKQKGHLFDILQTWWRMTHNSSNRSNITSL